MNTRTKTAPEPEVIFNEDDLDFLDWEAPADHIEQERYRLIQWNNLTGQWEFPLKYWAGTPIANDYELVDVEHQNGEEVEPGYLLDEITVAAYSKRAVWERKNENSQKEYAANYQPGFLLRYNHLIILKESHSDTPALITIKSHAGGYLDDALAAHRQTTVKAATRLMGGQPYPGYMFWLTLTGGELTSVGTKKKFRIKPPVAVLPDTSGLDDDGIEALLRSLFIGKELRSLIANQLFGEGKIWREEYEQLRLTAAATNGATSVMLIAEDLGGGTLTEVDLSDHKKGNWMRWAYSAGVFESEDETTAAYSALMRTGKGRICKNAGEQWALWYNHVNEMSVAKVQAAEALALRA